MLCRVFASMDQYKLDDLQDIFSFMDMNGDGTMIVTQLGLALRASGIVISDARLSSVVMMLGFRIFACLIFLPCLGKAVRRQRQN